MKSGLIIFLLCIVVYSSAGWSQHVDADILQVRLNRLYFSQGSEVGIATGTPFLIECSGDSIYGDIIDFAGEGISYSRASSEIENLEFNDSCIARLTVAAIDSTAEIDLGTDMPLELFNPTKETLFKRTTDSLIPLLADSCEISGSEMILYLNPNIRFSDNRRLTAETIIWWLKDLNYRSISYPVRFFFARLLPIDDGGALQLDAQTVKLTFIQAFPRADYFLSHPDFGIYNRNFFGTGPLVEIGYSSPGENLRAFVRNRYYRGEPVAFSRINLKHFQQSYRMKFEYENRQLDGYFGFGYDEDLAGMYDARAEYPYIATLIPGIGESSFTAGRFATSIYYRFDTKQAHLVYPHGKIADVNRWFSQHETGERYYPFDVAGGKSLHSTVTGQVSRIHLVYDNYLLYETGRYIADIVAREGCRSTIEKHRFGTEFDIRLAFFPASDDILPLSLISAVLELNDQNGKLPRNQQMNNPGWNNLSRGTSFIEDDNRIRFFSRSDNELFEEGSFFPLFRPWAYGVSAKQVKGLGFDFYGFPDLTQIREFTEISRGPR